MTLLSMPGTNPVAARFDAVADAVESAGWCVLPRAVPEEVCGALVARARAIEAEFRRARVGRDRGRREQPDVRQDEIRWLDAEHPAERGWLEWMGALGTQLNRRLYLGLQRFEGHFARYPPGARYARHRDRFTGVGPDADANRVLSCVAYLNPHWSADSGGELVLYQDTAAGEPGDELVRVRPELGTLVVFLSAAFPHEVLPATRARLAVTGWFYGNEPLARSTLA